MLKLKKDGILERTSYGGVTSDVTDTAYHYLYDNVEVDDGLTLKDFFLFVEKNLGMLDTLFGNWLEDYTYAALNNTPSEPMDSIEYVELAWAISHDGKRFNIPTMPDFYGLGYAEEDEGYFKKGDVIKWAVGFTPIENLVHLPFKLSPAVIIYDRKKNKEEQYITENYTLFQVIHAVIWEFSFHGSPSDTAKVLEDLVLQSERIKNGEEKTYPFEDFWKDLNIQNDDGA